jgi:hypothetical protein
MTSCPVSRSQSLPPALVARLRQLNALDGLLYDAAVAVFERALAAARGAPGSVERGAWDADAATFAQMQRALAASLAAGAPPDCAPLRAWYQLSDLEYEALIDADGHAAVPPEARAPAMQASFERTGGERFC